MLPIFALANRKRPAKFMKYCGNSSVGRAQPCQGWGREFESRFPLRIKEDNRMVVLFSFQ